MLARFAPLFPLLLAAPAGAQVASVAVSPASATLIAGNTLQLTAAVRDAAGRPMAAARITWSVVPFDVASVDSTGLVAARRTGRATVTAVAGGQRGTAVIEVEPRSVALVELTTPREEMVVGGSLVLRAVARAEDGEPLSGTVFTFRTSDERVAAVDQFGVVTGRGEGTAFLAAAAGSFRGDVRVRVVANRVTRMAITGPTRARTGEVVRLRAIGEDRRQLPVQDLSVRWSVSGMGASIGVDGDFVAEAPGTYLITANAGPVAASHAIRVAPRRETRSLAALAHRGIGDRQAGDVVVHGTTAYLATLSGRLLAFDLRDPARPVLADSLILAADTVHGLALSDDGQVAVVARSAAAPERNGLVILDLADPLHPRVLAEYQATLPAGARSVFLDGRTAFVADNAGTLRIISLATPSAPREVGGWAMNDSGTGRHLRGIHVRDGLAYLAYWRHGLIILDVGNGLQNGSAERPELVSHYAYSVADWYPPDMSAGAHAVLRHGNHLFLADEVRPGGADWASRERVPGVGMVHVFDITDPAAPVRVAEYRLPERGALGLAAEGDVLYVAFGEGGLRALDIGGALRGDLDAQGREIGAVWTGDSAGYRPNLPMARSVALAEGLAVVSDQNSGLWVVRLSTPVP